MKQLNLTLFGFAFLALTSCKHETATNEITPPPLPPTEVIKEEEETPSPIDEPMIDSLALDTDVPFKHPCPFEFYHMGEVRVSEERCDEIQCGNGWNPQLHSCTWVYGEHIYNQRGPDDLVTDYRMHIVDLDSSEIEMTAEFLESELFQDHIIATTFLDWKNKIFKTIWDPSETGKYPKPEHWIDD